MDVLNNSELMALLAPQGAYCVSLYLPTVRIGGDAGQQAPIRLKNLAAEAKELLVARGMRAAEARDFVRPALELAANEGFWKDQCDGLAVFLSSDGLRSYRLPSSFEELAVVGKQFHIAPLVPLSGDPGRYYILATSENRVRLFAGDRCRARELSVPGLPENLAEALHYDLAGLMRPFHSSIVAKGMGRRGAIHVDASLLDKAKDELIEFFHEIDRPLRKFLDDEKAPLVFAGVDFLFPIFREATSYPHLAGRHVSGNPDRLSPAELQQAAWSCVADSFDAPRRKAIDYYARLSGTGKASDDVRSVVAAAQDGQVDTLFVDVRQQRWGAWDATSGELHLHAERRPQSDDLVDLAVAETLRHRGTVYAVTPDELPARSPVAAIFRFDLTLAGWTPRTTLYAG